MSTLVRITFIRDCPYLTTVPVDLPAQYDDGAGDYYEVKNVITRKDVPATRLFLGSRRMFKPRIGLLQAFISYCGIPELLRLAVQTDERQRQDPR